MLRRDWLLFDSFDCAVSESIRISPRSPTEGMEVWIFSGTAH